MSESESQPQTNLDSKLEAEINDALGEMSIDEMLEQSEPSAARQPSKEQPTGSQDRELRTGRIMRIHGDDVFVEFGPRSEGICPLPQFKDKKPEIGESMDFIIERVADDGLLVLSREGAIQKAQWDALEIGQVVEGYCTGMIRGGLEVEVAQHRGFMPASHVDVHHVKDISVHLSQKIICQIIELNKKRGRIIVSRRKALEAENARKAQELLRTLEPGQVVDATITTLKPYGAFADIGGVDGLIHISDLSHTHLKDPSEVVKEGDDVQVKILNIDTEQDPPRIKLGLKQTIADPYDQAVAEIEEGKPTSGTVTRLMAFGAFVEIAPGVEGLIHISELSHDRVNKVSSAVSVGQVVNVQVLAIDTGKKRISLSLKALQDAPKGKAGADAQQAEKVRDEDPEMRKLKATLSDKFDGLKGGLG